MNINDKIQNGGKKKKLEPRINTNQHEQLIIFRDISY